jgi:ABC-type transport system involved in cytochrome c biogenesis permease subunit
MRAQNLNFTSSTVLWKIGFCEYVTKIVIMSAAMYSDARSCKAIRPVHLCLLHVIMQKISVAICQFFGVQRMGKSFHL